MNNISQEFLNNSINYQPINQSSNVALFYTSDVYGTYSNNNEHERKMDDYCDSRDAIKETLSSREVHYKTNREFSRIC